MRFSHGLGSRQVGPSTVLMNVKALRDLGQFPFPEWEKQNVFNRLSFLYLWRGRLFLSLFAYDASSQSDKEMAGVLGVLRVAPESLD